MERNQKSLNGTQKLPEELDVKLESLRCVSCNRFLGYYAVIEGTIVIKCKRCRCWNILDVRQEDVAIDKQQE